MAGRARVAASFIAGVLVLAAVLSCEEELLVAPDRNRAPETIITRAPQERGESGVWSRIFWRGWDEDGVVLAYDFAIDDTSFTSWKRTQRTDSTFLFRVDASDRDVEHTFFVAAVDNEGKRDPSPALRTFTAVDRHAPLVDSLWGTYSRPGESPTWFSDLDTIPAVAPGDTPYEVRFYWFGSDLDGEIVRYFWHIDEDAETEVVYEDTVSALAGNIAPKAPEDRTRYVLYVVAEDDAGLHGGAGDAGVLPARLSFAVDFTPHSAIDSILAQGTTNGVGWDDTLGEFSTAPVDTSFTWEELSGSLAGAVTLPGEAILTIYWHSTDPEEGCVKEVRWQTQSGAMFSGNTTSPWEVPEECDAGSGVSRGELLTEKLASGPVANPFKLWVRSRDSHERMEEPGPSFDFRMNYLPTVTVDSIGVDPGTGDVTICWHGTDRDDAAQEILYAVSLDSGSRESLGAATCKTYTDAELEPTVEEHTFNIRASNNFSSGLYVEADTTFTIE